MKRVAVVVVVALAWVSGCGIDLSQLKDLANKDKDGDTGDEGGTGQPVVTCDPIPNVALEVVSTQDPGPPPAMTGGTLVDGTYAQTAHVYYSNDPNSSDSKETFVFSQGTVKHVLADNGGADQISAGTVTTDGNTISFNLVCPQQAVVTGTYTATDTTLTLIVDDNPNRVITYTKQ